MVRLTSHAKLIFCNEYPQICLKAEDKNGFRTLAIMDPSKTFLLMLICVSVRIGLETLGKTFGNIETMSSLLSAYTILQGIIFLLLILRLMVLLSAQKRMAVITATLATVWFSLHASKTFNSCVLHRCSTRTAFHQYSKFFYTHAICRLPYDPAVPHSHVLCILECLSFLENMLCK